MSLLSKVSEHIFWRILMNNEQQTWILRKPIIGKKYVNGKANFPEGVWSRFIETKSGMATMSEEVFHETFVELDVSGLTRQVEEIVVRGLARSANREKIRQNAPAGTPLLEKRAYELYGEPVIDTIEMVEAILDLLLNQEKETK